MEFKRIIDDPTRLGRRLHGENILRKPRIVGRQSRGSNPEVSSVEEYFQITVYDECFCIFAVVVGDKPTYNITHGLLQLLPQKCASQECDSQVPYKLFEVVHYYSNDLPHPLAVSTKCVFKNGNRLMSTAEYHQIFMFSKLCSPLQFPNMNIALKLALTLPITSCVEIALVD